MKNIVICANLNDDSLELLRALKGSALLKESATIHMVHCFEIQIYTSDLAPYVFPTKEKYPEIEEASLRVLDELREKLEIPKERSVEKCFFSESPKKKIKDYLDEVDADLCIIATRGKHGSQGFFSSSFAEHMVKYSPCDIHIMRPNAEHHI